MADYAVLIPWVDCPDCPGSAGGKALLMEVRSALVRQPGEVCFPGGRMEAGEKPADTAVREACEELGVRPGDIEVSAVLEPLVMGDGRKVYPVTARLRLPDTGLASLSLSADEVAEAFLLPAGWLKSHKPAVYDLASTPESQFPEKLRCYLANYSHHLKIEKTPYWEYEGHGIWGLTARIINKII